MSVPNITSSSHKRFSDEENPDTKRAATDTDTNNVARVCLKVVYHHDYERASYNVCYLSPSCYNKLFGKDAENGKLVKVANLVYRAWFETGLPQKQIDFNAVCYADVGKDIVSEGSDSGRIWVSPFNLDMEGPREIKEIHFVVIPFGQLNHVGFEKGSQKVLASTLQEYVEDHLSGHVFCSGQSLFLLHPVVGPLKIKVDKWDHMNAAPDGQLSRKEAPLYGYLGKDTRMTFASDSAQLAVVEEVDPLEIKDFNFLVKKVTNVSNTVFCAAGNKESAAWKKGFEPLPLALPFNTIIQKIRKRLNGKILMIGDLQQYRYGKNWLLDISLTEVNTDASRRLQTSREMHATECNTKAFRYNGAKILLSGRNDVVFTTSLNNARKADEMTFEVVDMHLNDKLRFQETVYVNVEEVFDLVRKQNKTLLRNGHLVVGTARGEFLLKLVSCYGPPSPLIHETANLEDVWLACDETKIKLYCTKEKKIVLVENVDPLPAKQLFVKVSMEDEDDEEKAILEQEELAQMFRRALPERGVIHEKVTLTAITSKGERITFNVEEAIAKVSPQNKPDYRHLYHITDETAVSFEGMKGGNLMISSKPEQMSFEMIQNKLVSLGIGGMTEQFIDVITRATLSRSTFAEHAAELGLKPSRGLLLYGPPGTGKTLLARRLGEILGVSSERIKLYTGSEIWDKWLGNSEKNIRKMFADARADQKKHGKDSPLHVLIIDEIDGFLQSRSGAKERWESSAVNTFIAELDGISSNGRDSLNNILVIGLTNYLERLDEAAIRPGRLFPHIHIGLPDSKGRKEIFEIHTKNLREKGFLAADVDFDKLAEKTVGKTGAFIEGMVRGAAEYSYKRLWQQNVALEQISGHEAAKIGQKDFEESYLECLNRGKKNEELIQIDSSDKLAIKDIEEECKKLKLAGLGKEVVQLVADLRISQKYSSHLYKIGQAPTRGVMLYGPSGVGKTAFAKSLKKLLNLDGERFQYHMASDLWPDNGGKLKERLEKITKPARDAAKDLKQAAPLHVVVIDAIDSLYLHKRDVDTADQSVLNQFLSELGQMFPQDCSNLLIIGISHRGAFGLSDGILRHGMMGKHIEMKYPNERERKEILQLYLKDVPKDPTLDVAELLPWTADRSGAFIEGLVNQAVMQMARRCAKADVQLPEMENSLKALVTLDDCKRAYESMKTDDRWREMFL